MLQLVNVFVLSLAIAIGCVPLHSAPTGMCWRVEGRIIVYACGLLELLNASLSCKVIVVGSDRLPLALTEISLRVEGMIKRYEYGKRMVVVVSIYYRATLVE